MSELILLAALLALVWLMQMRYRLPDTRPAAAWQRELPRSAFPALRIRSRVAFSNLLTTHESYGDRAVAVSNCAAGHGQSRRHFTATRRESCLDLQLQYGGEAACAWACLGAGDCVTACPEDAIRMEGGSPRIDTQACTGCGQCVTSCPRQVLSLIPADAQIYMACASADEPAFRRSVCEVGCRDTRQCLGDRFLTPGIVRADGRRRVLDYTRSDNLLPLRALCPAGVYRDRISHRPQFSVNDFCTGCGQCMPVCPAEGCIVPEGAPAATPVGHSKVRIDPLCCVGCGLCLPHCPEGAIRVVGAVGYDLDLD